MKSFVVLILFQTASFACDSVAGGDLNGDKLVDIVADNKKGVHIYLQAVRNVTKEEWMKAQPKRLSQ